MSLAIKIACNGALSVETTLSSKVLCISITVFSTRGGCSRFRSTFGRGRHFSREQRSSNQQEWRDKMDLRNLPKMQVRVGVVTWPNDGAANYKVSQTLRLRWYVAYMM